MNRSARHGILFPLVILPHATMQNVSTSAIMTENGHSGGCAASGGLVPKWPVEIVGILATEHKSEPNSDSRISSECRRHTVISKGGYRESPDAESPAEGFFAGG
ncbi:hypothetical protein BDP67DRAFT_533657 [Colletotrichum lupini]|nr:hypothetical protein BDP67DRAFT_533657 [Colletotrichum lupini]